MKAAQLFGPNDIRIESVPTPPLGDTDVLLKIKKVGICGTDLHLYSGGIPAAYPLTLGHEFVGEIAQVGKSVHALKPGMRAVAEHVLGCGTCAYCKQGRKNLCTQPTVFGMQLPGALAEYMVIPQELIYPLPDSITDDAAVLIEPLSIAVYAVRKANVNVGDLVAVVGQGPIGLFLDQIATAAGATVFGFDVLESRLQWARKHGYAVDVFSAAAPEVVESFKQTSESAGADVVFEAVGKEPTVQLAANLAKAGGKVMVMGVFEKPVALDMMQIVKRELLIEGAWTCIFSFPPTIELLRSNKLETDGLITHRYAFANVTQAFTEAQTYNDNRIKSVIEF